MNTVLEQLPQSQHQIRKSLWILSFRLCKILFVFATLYGILLLLFLSGNILELYIDPFVSEYEAVSFAMLWSAQAILSLVQAVFILYATLSWAREVYYINGEQLIMYRGIFMLEEKVYQLKHFHAVKLRQSWLGKLCRYGTIIIEHEAFAHRDSNLVLVNIPDAKHYQRVLRQYLQDKYEPTVAHFDNPDRDSQAHQ